MSENLDVLQEDIDKRKERLKLLAVLLFAGILTLVAWREAMRWQIEELYILAYTLGRGGLDRMTAHDWTRLQQVLDQHYQYLDKFSRDISGMSQAQAEARAALYAQSAYQAYSVGQEQQAGKGALVLPAHPGDISTECGSNCRCHWRIANRSDGGWDCFWEIDKDAESCPDCWKRAEEWWPLTIMPERNGQGPGL